MRILKLAATTSLAAVMLTAGAGQPRADHDGWWDSRGRSVQPRQRTQQNWWWQRQYAPPAQARPGPGSRSDDGSLNWFQPQAELPRSQNVEPEAPPARAPVVYTYRPDPLVDLADAGLARPAVNWGAAGRQARAVHQALKSGTAGVQVTERQRDAIVAFYRERGFAPLWVSGEGDWGRAERLLGELAQADAYGLVPEDYLPSDLNSFAGDPGAAAGDPEQLARLELGLTAAALRYAMDASGGRIAPNRLSVFHDLTPPTVDGGVALARLAEEPDAGAYLASLHPVHPAYKAMQRELAELTARTDRDEPPIAAGPVIKPGGSDARIPAIRDRLARLGHLAPPDAAADDIVASPIGMERPLAGTETEAPLFGSAGNVVRLDVVLPGDAAGNAEPGAPGPDMGEPGAAVGGSVASAEGFSRSQAYDEATVEAVKAFQASAGITVDGIIGPQTVAAFNSSNTEERIRKVVYAMERLRWLPRDFGAKYVFVNAASFEAVAVENGAAIWSSKVIVGRPEHQTVSFSDQFETVVFNPYWGVPASIIVNEFLPEIRRDPSWIDRKGYEVTDLNGRVIPSYSVDWSNLNPKKLTFGMRQPPGPDNALGQIKFLFPNKHAIYLHDTPSKPLFDKPVRAYSYGCVRVQDPWGFAEVLLGWDQDRIASTRASTRDYSVPVEQEIKVHLSYFTAWPDESGRMRYYDDVYGRDRLLERAFGTLTVASR